MIVALEPKNNDDAEFVENFLNKSKLRYNLYDSVLFKFDFQKTTIFPYPCKKIFFIKFSNELPKFYFGWIIFSFIQLLGIVQGWNNTIINSSGIISILFLLSSFFWKTPFLKMIIYLGLKKEGFKGKYKYIKLEESIDRRYFKGAED